MFVNSYNIIFIHITMETRFPVCAGTTELEPIPQAQSKININLSQFADCLNYYSEFLNCN